MVCSSEQLLPPISGTRVSILQRNKEEAKAFASSLAIHSKVSSYPGQLRETGISTETCSREPESIPS